MKQLLRLKNRISDFTNNKDRGNDALVMIGILALATVVSMLLTRLEFHESNVINIFILGVLLVSLRTDGYLYGICASVLSVLAFNFFFTEPLYTFRANGREYLVTFPLMLIVAVITSTLTSRVKKAAALSRLREKRNETLFRISRNLLTTGSIDQILSMTAVSAADLSGSSVMIYLTDREHGLSEPYLYSAGDGGDLKALLSEKERALALQAVREGTILESRMYYVPIVGRSAPLGVIGIDCGGGSPTEEQALMFRAIAAQAALSIERELSNARQQASRLETESERVKSNLLRAVSHDLRTPLTGVVGSSSTLLENWDKIDDAAKLSLISGIYDDAVWLSNSVENILNITRMDDGRIEVRKSLEAPEEVIAEAAARVQKYADGRTIVTRAPESLMLVEMDAGLMKQLLVNLLDNAVKFTQDGAEIRVSVCARDGFAVFEVADNGPGIAEKDLPYVFDRFYTTGAGPEKRKGMGLGLAICKSIALAHGGKISVSNAREGGAVFRVSVPIGGGGSE